MSTKKLQIVGRVITTDETFTQSGVAADAKATGDAIAAINTLVGDTAVATQISNATADVVRTSDVITSEEIAAICGETIYDASEVEL